MGLEVINDIRKRKGLSIEALSKESGVPIGTLSKITAGITKNPNLETVKAIARALDCTLDDFDDNKTETIKEVQQSETNLTNNLISKFEQLNINGKNEAIKRVEELTYIPKYQKEEQDDFLMPIAAHNDNYSEEQLKLMQEDIDEL